MHVYDVLVYICVRHVCSPSHGLGLVQPRKAISFEAEAAELNLRNLYFPIFLWLL
jgi:hypothetical protein